MLMSEQWCGEKHHRLRSEEQEESAVHPRPEIDEVSDQPRKCPQESMSQYIQPYFSILWGLLCLRMTGYALLLNLNGVGIPSALISGGAVAIH